MVVRLFGIIIHLLVRSDISRFHKQNVPLVGSKVFWFSFKHEQGGRVTTALLNSTSRQSFNMVLYFLIQSGQKQQSSNFVIVRTWVCQVHFNKNTSRALSRQNQTKTKWNQIDGPS